MLICSKVMILLDIYIDRESTNNNEKLLQEFENGF